MLTITIMKTYPKRLTMDEKRKNLFIRYERK